MTPRPHTRMFSFRIIIIFISLAFVFHNRLASTLSLTSLRFPAKKIKRIPGFAGIRGGQASSRVLERVAEIGRHEGEGWCVAWRPDGEMLASCGGDRT
eukprot:1177629-Amorphochlora_amoeboformis.AAC.1